MGGVGEGEEPTQREDGSHEITNKFKTFLISGLHDRGGGWRYCQYIV